MNRRGLTLMEVLVVIVVVGFISAFVFPVVAQSRAAAARTSCLVNSRELALATSLYEQDHQSRIFPFGYNVKGGFTTWWGDLKTGDPTKGLLYPYTKSGIIRGCPGAEELPNDQPYPFTMGLGMNFRLFYRYPPMKGRIEFTTFSTSEFDRPAETILCGDTARLSEDGNGVVSSPWLFGDSTANHLHARHAREVANVTWLDGHASSHQLAYAVHAIGEPKHTISPDVLKANQLGDLLKFPREHPESPVSTERDQFYYLLEKPRGT